MRYSSRSGAISPSRYRLLDRLTAAMYSPFYHTQQQNHSTGGDHHFRHAALRAAGENAGKERAHAKQAADCRHADRQTKIPVDLRLCRAAERVVLRTETHERPVAARGLLLAHEKLHADDGVGHDEEDDGEVDGQVARRDDVKQLAAEILQVALVFQAERIEQRVHVRDGVHEALALRHGRGEHTVEVDVIVALRVVVERGVRHDERKRHRDRAVGDDADRLHLPHERERRAVDRDGRALCDQAVDQRRAAGQGDLAVAVDGGLIVRERQLRQTGGRQQAVVAAERDEVWVAHGLQHVLQLLLLVGDGHGIDGALQGGKFHGVLVVRARAHAADAHLKEVGKCAVEPVRRQRFAHGVGAFAVGGEGIVERVRLGSG